MPRWGKALASILLFFTVIFGSFIVYEYTFSLLQMRDFIVFSGTIAILSLGAPFTLYAFMGMTIELVLGKDSKCFKIMMKYNKLTMKCLYYLFFIGLIGGFPASFAVNIYLLDNGYKTCDKISWMSPTTYVKDLSLCDR
ncbi:DUF1240 domain-containing protein [Morganella morganii]|uniref:DUF1240 domain-containing protein n=1 Tax=Morganella morganii TaxID=582 RepID=UPI0030CB883B